MPIWILRLSVASILLGMIVVPILLISYLYSFAKMAVGEPKDFGGGVYFFPVCSREFARSLSKFKSEHPDLKVTAIVPPDHGRMYGYLVNFENKNP